MLPECVNTNEINKFVLHNHIFIFLTEQNGDLVEKLFPRKKWGQNFLQDANYINKIIEASSLVSNDTVIEIGPGKGILTKAIAPLVKKLIAIEIDEKLCNYLKNILKDYPNVQIIQGNFLKIDLIPNKPVSSLKFIGNIPYYITTPILFRLIEYYNKGYQINLAVLMMQKEVAQRIVAKCGNKDYGVLSVAIQFYTQPQIISYVPKDVFYPKPKVDSAIIKMVFPSGDRFQVKNKEFFIKTVKAAFGQRRKILVNSLSKGLKIKKDCLASMLIKNGFNPNQRAENLSLNDFIRLSEVVYGQEKNYC